MLKKCFLLFAAFSAFGGETALPELGTPEGWQAQANVPMTVKEGRLALTLDALTKATPVRLMLKTPLAVPEGNELSFRAAMDNVYELDLNPIVRDANGTEFRMLTTSNATLKGGMLLGARFRGGLKRLGEVRVRVKGLRDPLRESFVRLGSPGPQPLKFPVTLVALELAPRTEKPRKNTLYLRDFQFTDTDRKSSAYYYAFDDAERFGEVDGLPSISFADLGLHRGKRFEVDWEIRRDYAGQPFMTGSEELDLDPKSSVPVVLQLEKRIQFPLKTPGTYWVRVNTRWTDTREKPRFLEHEYRLFIVKGEAGVPAAAIKAEARVGRGMIRIAPERAALVWSEKEPWKVAVRFFDAAGKNVHAEARDAGKNLLFSEKATIPASGTMVFDLSKLAPGAYDFCVTVLDKGAEIDSLTRLIGKKSDPEKTAFKLPPGTPSARQLIDGPKPMFHLMPHMGNRVDELVKIRGMMDLVGSVSKDFEYQVSWAKAEPLPGIYDFSELDAVLDYAAQKGFKVLVWPTFDPPEWVPSDYTMNADGDIFGHKMYLFHGARLNQFHSPAIRDGRVEFVRRTVLQTRNHAATQGYYYLVEHPGEAPYVGWYEGFDPLTLTDYRKTMAKKYADIGAANKAWGTKFASFDAIVPPRYDDDSASPKFRLDWLRFRVEAIRSFFLDCAKAARAADPHRLLMLYGNGVIFEDAAEFAKLNMMSANGGCERPDLFGEGMTRVADAGLPQRAEEVSVTRWAADYPTRLDTSLFSMLLGGGVNTSCKMFFPIERVLPTKDLNVIRKPEWALDRYERFQSIWTELKPTEVLAGDVRYFANTNAQILRARSTAFSGGDPWATMLFLDSQVPFWCAPGKDWKKAKLVVLPQSRLENLEQAVIDDILDYVRNGGNILMNAGTGRVCVENLRNDWALLRAFGFNPPGEIRESQYAELCTASDDSMTGQVRHFWNAGKQPGETVAVLKGKNLPGITMLPFGKGKVFVVWAREIQPPGRIPHHEKPFLRAIAEQCGANLPVSASARVFWTNLLKHKENGNFYLLVMRSTQGDAKVVDGVVRPSVPAGTYRVSEMIQPGNNVEMSSDALNSEGIKVHLKNREVAIYKLERMRK